VSAVTVAIDPEISRKEVEAAFEVALRIEGAEDLALFDFDLTYDPDVVSVSDIEEGGFLSTGGHFVFSKGPEYPVTGTVSFAAATSAPEGVDGSGILAVLHLEALSVGTSPLTLAEVRLARRGEEGEPFSPDVAEDGTVIVQEEVCQAVDLVALAVTPDPLVADREATFAASVEGDEPITYTWAFGDGTPGQTGEGLDAVQHTYDEAGVYTATLVVENCPEDGPFSDGMTRTLTVEPLCELAIIDLDSDSPAALGDPIRFAALVTGTAPITHTWTFGDGSPPVSGVGLDAVTYTYEATGTYGVELTVENECGDTRDEITAEVVEEPLVVSIDPQSSAVPGGATFTVGVVVEGAVDLMGYEFDLSYDSSAVSVVDVEDGGFLGQEGRSVVEIGPFYPTTGTVTFDAFSLPPPADGVDGDGTLAVVTLQAGTVSGTSLLDLIDGAVSLFAVSSGDPLIPTSLRDGTVTIGGNKVFLPVVLRDP
jgi:PKD repeat protein